MYVRVIHVKLFVTEKIVMTGWNNIVTVARELWDFILNASSKNWTEFLDVSQIAGTPKKKEKGEEKTDSIT